MSLAKKLQKWEENDLISTEQKEKIIKFEKQHNGGLFIKMSLGVAALLIGLGICLIIASNWDVIPAWLKILGTFGISILFAFGAYHEQKTARHKLKELFLILCFSMIAALIGLVGQTFNLDGGWHSFALFWALLGLPYVICSRSRIFNGMWICLFFSGIFNGMFWINFWNLLITVFPWIQMLKFEDYIIPFTLLFVALLTLFNYGARKLDSRICKYTVLAESFGILCTMCAYYTIFCCGFCYMWDSDKLTGGIAHILVLAYLAFRMSMAIREQNISAFKHNAFAAEFYIFLIFISRFSDLFATGVGFIFGGLLILGFIYLLKKTSKFIKGMEIFNA